MIRTPLLLALAALAVAGARALRPVPLDLDGLSADAPAWLDQLVERNA